MIHLYPYLRLTVATSGETVSVRFHQSPSMQTSAVISSPFHQKWSKSLTRSVRSTWIRKRERNSIAAFTPTTSTSVHKQLHSLNSQRFLNNYAKYRSSLEALRLHLNNPNSENGMENYDNKAFQAAERAVTLLAQRNKTWRRLAPIVELATATTTGTSVTHNDGERHSVSSIVDIGCDHGLLAIALASSGKFSQVIGTDVSERALNDGALAFNEKVKEVLERGQSSDPALGFNSVLPLEFRWGDGLEPLNPGEADAVCLAGMGVDSMSSILHGETSPSQMASDFEGVWSVKRQKMQLDYLQCQKLYLQPPTSRPRKLMQLYRSIQCNQNGNSIKANGNGWVLTDERILKLKKRWYITSVFSRIHDNIDYRSSNISGERFLLPGHLLSRSPDKVQQEEYRAYVEHHLRWLDKDLLLNGKLCREDVIWREANNVSLGKIMQ